MNFFRLETDMRDERCVAVSSQLAGSITTNSCDDSTNLQRCYIPLIQMVRIRI